MITKRELQKQGFKAVIGFEPLFIDRTGKVYHFAQQRFLKISPKYRITYNGQAFSVPKLILLVFGKQPYQNKRHVKFADGNKTNLNVQNLSYTEKRQNIAICHTQLMKAARSTFKCQNAIKPVMRSKHGYIYVRLHVCECSDPM